MHKYTVELRIEGAALIPSEVTKKLNLQPCQIRENTVVSSDRRNPNALWCYSGAVANQEWNSLEDGLLYLLDELLPKHDLIQENFGEFSIYWWCGHFQQSFDGGPTFSSELFRKLAEFGVPLTLDNYFSEEKPKSQINTSGKNLSR